MNKKYQVFVSSTYADLEEERRSVIQTVIGMDCIPAGMELFPATDEEQFEFIKRVIDDCDYYLLIIGGRYGSTTAASWRTASSRSPSIKDGHNAALAASGAGRPLVAPLGS